MRRKRPAWWWRARVTSISISPGYATLRHAATAAPRSNADSRLPQRSNEVLEPVVGGYCTGLARAPYYVHRLGTRPEPFVTINLREDGVTRVGIAFSGGPGPADIVDCVKLAEHLGYESAWVAEGHGGDQFATLAAAAVQTSRIALGTGITSVFVRTIPTIAMAAATVDDLSGGRFILGVGSSHKVQVEAEHGVAYAKPLTRTREAVAAIRALLRDGQLNYDGETFRIEHFDLWFAPHRPAMPIYLSAVFPKMTALAGEIADGLILTRSTLATAAQARHVNRRGIRTPFSG